MKSETIPVTVANGKKFAGSHWIVKTSNYQAMRTPHIVIDATTARPVRGLFWGLPQKSHELSALIPTLSVAGGVTLVNGTAGNNVLISLAAGAQAWTNNSAVNFISHRKAAIKQ